MPSAHLPCARLAVPCALYPQLSCSHVCGYHSMLLIRACVAIHYSQSGALEKPWKADCGKSWMLYWWVDVVMSTMQATVCCPSTVHCYLRSFLTTQGISILSIVQRTSEARIQRVATILVPDNTGQPAWVASSSYMVMSPSCQPSRPGT